MTDEYEKEDDEEYEDEEATSESEEEYEDEAEDAEASDESEESEEEEDSVASWGYEEKKSRFSKEMIAGFAAIGVLVAIFGIVVYKKMPGAGDSTEIAAGPEASLGNPEGSLGDPEGTATPPEEDPNDPFREGAENGAVVADLGLQTEPGEGDGTFNASLGGDELTDPNLITNGSPGIASTGTLSETADPFPNEGSGGPGTTSDPFINDGSLGNAEPFASNSETPDLFSGQPETGLNSNSEPPFGTSSTGTSAATDEFGRPLASNEFGSGQPESSTAFPNSGTSEFADSSRPDPFGGPDLSGPDLSSGTGSTYADTGSTELGSSDPLGNEPFPQGNQFAQNQPNIDESLGNFPSESTSQPDSLSTGNEPFSSSTNNEPFGTDAGTGTSEPTGLFDRGAETSENSGSLNDPSSTALPNDSGFGNDTLPGGEFGTPQPSATPFGREEPFGTTDTGSTETVFGNSESASPSSEPFGTPTSTVSNDPFPGSTGEPSTGFESGNEFNSRPEEPVNLFPDTNSLPTSTASNEPFQPPLTSSPGSSFSSNSAAPVTSGPFGNEAFSADSSAGPSTFASQPANPGTYTVQDGDSYWNISKKVYGTAKYFQVLADHNRRTIADPQKMKTGVAIETPPASVLQRQLKTVRRAAPTGLAGRIEPSGRADRAASSGSNNAASSAAESVVVGRRETQPKEPSGILFNQQGYPLYRIGKTDTLTSIASDHLGRASRWQQVYNMNRDQLQSPDKLQIGMLLKLPSDASRVPLVDRTSSLR